MGRSWTELFQIAGVALPGDVTLDDISHGIDDPELILYLRRLPELDARDRDVLRAVLRAFFDHTDDERTTRRPDAHQLALPGTLA
jgi:hypothetical protein